jgi:hypothetical protein
MNTEEHDDLWELLGRAKKPEASPFFSRNVLRALREEQEKKVSVLGWLRAHWRVAAISCGALAVIATVSVRQLTHKERPDTLIALATQVSVSPDYQVINHLDELLDSEQNSVWLEASAH